MYSITTQFLKEQIPGTSLSDLMRCYATELQDQNVSSFSEYQNAIEFYNRNSIASVFMQNYGEDYKALMSK